MLSNKTNKCITVAETFTQNYELFLFKKKTRWSHDLESWPTTNVGQGCTIGSAAVNAFKYQTICIRFCNAYVMFLQKKKYKNVRLRVRPTLLQTISLTFPSRSQNNFPSLDILQSKEDLQKKNHFNTAFQQNEEPTVVLFTTRKQKCQLCHQYCVKLNENFSN